MPRAARHARHAVAVRTELQRLGFTLFSRPGAHSDTVVAAYSAGERRRSALLKRLREEHGIVLSGGQAELAGKILRFGTMGDVREDDFVARLPRSSKLAAHKWCRLKYGSTKGRANHGTVERIASSIGASYVTR